MNKAIVIGRLVEDPKIGQSSNQETKIAWIKIAVPRKKRKGQEQTADFIRCSAFNGSAEILEKYFKKGNRIGIVGHIQTGVYEDKENRKISTTEIIIEEIDFIENKNTSKDEEKDGCIDEENDYPFR